MSDGAGIGTSMWCPECRHHRTVLDDHTEATVSGTSYSYSTTENYYRVLNLSCGHEREFPAGSTTFRDPGA